MNISDLLKLKYPSELDATAINMGDEELTRALMSDTALTVFAKGNSGTTLQTYDYTDGHVQSSTATGNHTIAFSNWPPTGNRGILVVVGIAFGNFTITFPTINWEMSDGTTTTVFATYLAANSGREALQTGTDPDTFKFWTDDAGTSISGKLI